MRVDIYGDESSQTGHQYMVLTAVMVATDDVADVANEINVARDPRWRAQEMKWTKTNRMILPSYLSVAKKWDALTRAGQVVTHSMIVNCSALDHRAFNRGDPDLGFNKFSYQLLVKCGRHYGAGHSLFAYLDQRTTVHDPNELAEIVNSGLRKRWKIAGSPLRKCVHRNSKSSVLIQVADLIGGAIAFHKNEHDRAPGANRAKQDLAEYLAGLRGMKRLGSDTPYREQTFTVWNFQLR